MQLPEPMDTIGPRTWPLLYLEIIIYTVFLTFTTKEWIKPSSLQLIRPKLPKSKRNREKLLNVMDL